MAPYWILFATPVIASMMGADRRDRRHLLPLIVFGVLATLMIGTRYQVGADWVAYLRIMNNLRVASFADAVLTTDPGYALLNWTMTQGGLGMTGVNLVCGAIFMWGLIDFAWRTQNPWLAVMVAVPYLLIVVAMGYTRQGVALGLEFLALRMLAEGKYRRFFLAIVCAATFHKTAILLSLLGIFSGPNPLTLVRSVAGAILGYLSFLAFLEDHYESLLSYYVEAKLDSSGGMIRVLMNALPGAIFLAYYRLWKRKAPAGGPWLLFSIASVLCVAVVQQATTAVDRLALYLAPLQLQVWSHLPLLARGLLLKPAIVAYHAVVLFVWLQYATHSRFWLPYQSVLLP